MEDITNLSPAETLEITEPFLFSKTCAFCKKAFKHKSRNAKFCTDQHREFYNKRRKKSKILRDENKTLYRFKARAHALAVDICKARYDQLGLEWCCSECQTKESPEVKIECHHENQNFLDNSPENVKPVCTKCHHSKHTVPLTREELIDKAGLEFVLMFEPIYSFKINILKHEQITVA